MALPVNNHRSLVEEDIHLWRVESVLGGLELDWVVQRVLGMIHHDLFRPDVTIRIQDLVQLGQVDITSESDNLLDDGGYGCVVGVCLDETTTILDALGRSRLVLSDD